MKRPRSAPSEPRTGALLVCGLFSGVNLCGLLLPRGIQGIWRWTAAWLRAGAEDLDDWVPLLKAYSVQAAITLELQDRLQLTDRSTGKCVPVWGRIMGCGFPLGAVWESAGRNFASFWDAVSETCLKRKVCPRIHARNGMCFPPPTCQQKGLRSSCSGGLSFNCKWAR